MISKEKWQQVDELTAQGVPLLEIASRLELKVGTIYNRRAAMRRAGLMEPAPAAYEGDDRTIKKCGSCQQRKPVDQFPKNSSKSDGLATECSECRKTFDRQYYETHKEKWVEREAKLRESDPEFLKTKNREAAARYRANPNNTIRLRYLKKRFGITTDQYLEKWERQSGLCAICQSESRGSKSRLHVDHDHTTNKIRDLLCFSCNSGLGKFEDNEAWLQAALDYVRRHRNTP